MGDRETSFVLFETYQGYEIHVSEHGHFALRKVGAKGEPRPIGGGSSWRGCTSLRLAREEVDARIKRAGQVTHHAKVAVEVLLVDIVTGEVKPAIFERAVRKAGEEGYRFRSLGGDVFTHKQVSVLAAQRLGPRGPDPLPLVLSKEQFERVKNHVECIAHENRAIKEHSKERAQLRAKIDATLGRKVKDSYSSRDEFTFGASGHYPNLSEADTYKLEDALLKALGLERQS
jgi:hypothetical protein